METLAAREAGEPDPHEHVDRSAGYGQGRGAPPLRAGVLIESQTGADDPVGQLLRQPSVRRDGNETFRLDELFGRGFAVVGRKQADLRLGAEAGAVLERLGGRLVPLEGLEIAEGQADRLFDAHPAAVVRPDRYVFGVVDDDWSLDALVLELGRKLALR